ncbi:hypothetical protein HYW39_00820 [Candidatus Curtissbacteria bacterium]|nr:hypothetical protein [Candidatus Curtissbacteria bacterium]
MKIVLFVILPPIFILTFLVQIASAHNSPSTSGSCPPGHIVIDKVGDTYICDHPGTSGENPLGNITLPGDLAESTKPSNIINSLVGLIIAIAGLLFFFYLLIGGIRYMTAGGDSKAIGSATSAITTALIGFLLVISAYFIALFISEVFNIEILRPNIPVLVGL